MADVVEQASERYFVACRTCKKAEGIPMNEIEEYVKTHRGHEFSLIPMKDLQFERHFTTWFMHFMDWPVEEED